MDPYTAILIQLNILMFGLAALFAYQMANRPRKAAKRPYARRKFWVKPYLRKRLDFGFYEQLVPDLQGSADYFNFLRIDKELFEQILARIEHRIVKQDTTFRQSITPATRLALTLRYLATGDSYKSIGYGFRVSPSLISVIVRDVCQAIVDEYLEQEIVCPKTPEEWKVVSDGFSTRWNFEHTVGAMDGKHVRIQKPPKGGSLYYNYKHYHSIILFALVDANYRFLYIDVGHYGGAGDAGIFNDSDFSAALEGGYAGLPEPEPLAHDDSKDIDYFLVGDDAFGLRTWLMKPYSLRYMTKAERIFNYRLSRARRVVENVFGILAHR